MFLFLLVCFEVYREIPCTLHPVITSYRKWTSYDSQWLLRFALGLVTFSGYEESKEIQQALHVFALLLQQKYLNLSKQAHKSTFFVN